MEQGKNLIGYIVKVKFKNAVAGYASHPRFQIYDSTSNVSRFTPIL